jgi:serine/threonine-protein phosphatase 5
MTETIGEAEAAKSRGNACFSAGHYGAAVQEYTRAIAVASGAELKQLHIYLSNRAFCQIRLENLGCAVDDATQAVQLQPLFAKGYYRRGCSYVGLLKFKDAMKDFQAVLKICPADVEAQARLKECKKQVQYAAFAAAIDSGKAKKKKIEEPIEALLNEPPVAGASYEGPRYEGREKTPIDRKFIEELMDFFTAEKVLPKRYALHLVKDAYDHLKKLSTLVKVPLESQGAEAAGEIAKEVIVFGDIHGQAYDLMAQLRRLFAETAGAEIPQMLFNGDIVDRGSFGVPCVLLICALVLSGRVFVNRGNHETTAMSRLYGFAGEAVAIYDETFYEVCSEFFCALPLAHVVGEAVFVTHGGLFSSDQVTLKDIDAVNRDTEPGDSGLMTEMLWADPMAGEGRAPSKRGVGLCFGADVTANFLAMNNLQLVIRSHEMKDEGWELEHGGKLITVFSAPNYCDQMGNKGAVVRLRLDTEGKVQYKVETFEAVPHPFKPAMCYANKMLFGQNFASV